MKVSICLCPFICSLEQSKNKRKNDIPELKLLLNKDMSLIKIDYTSEEDMRIIARTKIEEITGYKYSSVEQVYTFNNNGNIEILYLCMLSESYIKKLNDNYKLFSFDIEINKYIVIGNNTFKYKTKQEIVGKSIIYTHEPSENNNDLIMILTTYKYIKSRVDITDIIYKFLPDKFTLESVRLLYEYISGKIVDKSNFRKKILPNVKPLDEIVDGKGFRPTRLYTVVPNENNIWL